MKVLKVGDKVVSVNNQLLSAPNGGGTTPGAPGDITFYDYDGTIVTSWTLEELATKTALPDYPSHEGLTCQGWNWSLADLKTTNRKMNRSNSQHTKNTITNRLNGHNNN